MHDTPDTPGDKPISPSQRRRILNEKLFRNSNDRIAASGQRLLNQAGVPKHDFQLEFTCECSRAMCVDRICLTVPQYRAVRDCEWYFILKPGHEQADIESVIERHDDFVIVRKEPALAAEVPSPPTIHT
jgi:hypothetical protein